MSTIIEFGGGSATLEGDALAGDVIKDKTFYNTDANEIQTGTLELTGNAVAGDVVKGKTFYNINPKDQITGTLELTGSAAASEVLDGCTFYKDNPTVKITGNMPNKGAVTQTINPGGSYTIPAGYHNGSGKVTANPNQNSGTYTPTSRSTSLDMGVNNTYRYINTNSVPNSNSGTYTYAANSTGGTVDLGTTNTYRYVNASNVYAKGKVDGRALSVRATGSGNYTSNVTVSCTVGDIIVWGYCIAGSNTTNYNLSSYTTGASLIGQFILRNDGPIAKVGVFKATSTSVTLKLPSGRTGYICMKY